MTTDNVTEQAITEAPVPEVADTPDTSAAQTPAPEAEDYSFIPAKFVRDGKPDFKRLAESYQSLEKKFSSRGGVPVSAPDEYEAPESTLGYSLNDEQLSAFKQEALAAGFTKEQFTFAMQRYEQALANFAPPAEHAAAQLKEIWGDQFNDNLQAARRAFDNFAPSSLSPDHPVLNHPVVMQLLAQIGGELKEDNAPGRGSPAAGLTHADVLKMQSDPNYKNDSDAQARVTAWYEHNFR
ncbi:hypothetical protein Q9Q94_10290 [Uliginosibacterium sp. 31-16]|uniref:hypothetical protein n=1 Tax=Uliginosibacterium sp. 31-16 TaxID=3068315 RepID=UPI00273F1FC4|nr:hypothetical protein [Uliginosibacterium sp. 31-16]MDP5239924.1 hypothetical protein [Uliginosibacterium sp. 31-16]